MARWSLGASSCALKQYRDWTKRAQDSINKVFKQYVASEPHDDEQLSAPSRRKLPGNSDGSDLYSQTMAVDLMYLTGSKSHKRFKRASQLDVSAYTR
ncbi:hypothetical protein PtrSN001A_011752, partial [Pyrenophora tritici-repentis]